MLYGFVVIAVKWMEKLYRELYELGAFLARIV